MSADARVARAIIEVRKQLTVGQLPRSLRVAVQDLIIEAMDAIHLDEDDIEEYR